MAYSRNWDGRPENPHLSGWHWIEDADGLRPLLWRGTDWPYKIDMEEWQDGFAVLSARDLSAGYYHGPVLMPPTVERLFMTQVLAQG